MKTAPTLIDRLYRASFRRDPNPSWQSNAGMRAALLSTRRFVVDDKMSAFMAELSNEAFLKIWPNERLAVRIADSLRVSARLPHEAIWVEYNLHAYQRRAHELQGEPSRNSERETPSREGWLIQQHPKIASACIMHLFTSTDEVQDDGYSAWTYPFAFGWTSDDSPLPWRRAAHSSRFFAQKPTLVGANVAPSAAGSLVGIPIYHHDNVDCVHSPLITVPEAALHSLCRELLTEWMGVLRRAWALLATIDHLPLTSSTVRTSKGFLARGQIRKFLDHTTITLNIPAKRDTRVLARKMIAIAHRKRHEVRGHWRDDWRHPPAKTCDPHLWETLDEDADHIHCMVCHGRQIYIHKHERGDASLGYTTHDYRLKHEEVA